MAIICLPIDASGGAPTYTAQQTREAFSGLHYNGTSRPLGGQSGTALGSAPALSVSSTTWTVGAGNFLVDPAFTTTQAPYLVANDTTATGSVTAANATQSRIDAIDLQISDTAIDSSGARLASFQYAVGTAGTGLAPSVTARSVRVATINVPASGGGSPTITQYPVYTVAAGGILPIFNNTTRDALITNPSAGMAVYRLDTRYMELYDATLGWTANAGTLLGTVNTINQTTSTGTNGTTTVLSPDLVLTVPNIQANRNYRVVWGGWYRVSVANTLAASVVKVQAGSAVTVGSTTIGSVGKWVPQTSNGPEDSNECIWVPSASGTWNLAVGVVSKSGTGASAISGGQQNAFLSVYAA